jgi:hypothetical protein
LLCMREARARGERALIPHGIVRVISCALHLTIGGCAATLLTCH